MCFGAVCAAEHVVGIEQVGTKPLSVGLGVLAAWGFLSLPYNFDFSGLHTSLTFLSARAVPFCFVCLCRIKGFNEPAMRLFDWESASESEIRKLMPIVEPVIAIPPTECCPLARATGC